MTKPINKPVRDNIPDICRNNGQHPSIRILDDREYSRELNKKLVEEVGEYLADNEIEELADIIEVVEALAERQGHSIEDVMDIKRRKQSINGAFRDKIYLISVDD